MLLPLYADLKLNYNNIKLLPKRFIREKTKGQSVSEIQIVYYTKSDFKLLVIPHKDMQK